MRSWILTAVLACASLPAAAQSTANVPTANKDAGVATLIGFVFPGGGQYYSEATGKGLMYTVLVGGAIGIGVLKSHGDKYTSDLVQVPRTSQNPLGLEFQQRLTEHANHAPLIVGAGIGGTMWLLAALDAANDARNANAKRARVSVITTPRSVGLALAF